MVSYWRTAFCLGLAWPWGAVDASSLTLDTSLLPHSVEQGRSIKLGILGHALAQDLHSLDLSSWEEQVHLEQIEAPEANGSEAVDAKQQSLWLELFPRKTGLLQLPALRFAGEQTPPLSIEVSSAMQNHAPLEITLHQSRRQAWQRQQLVVAVEIFTAARFYSLELESFKSKGFEILSLEQQRIGANTQTNAAEVKPGTRLVWIVFPLVAGNYQLELPAILFLQGGSVNYRFYLPKIQIDVRPLPAYVPPTLPVGRLKLDSKVDGLQRFISGDLAYWNIQLSSEGILPIWLPAYFKEIESGWDIEFLPAETTLHSQMNKHGLSVNKRYRIPFRPMFSGAIALPDIQLQFFDPDSGKIDARTHRPQRMWVYGRVWLLSMLLGVGALTIWVYPGVKRQWQQRHASYRLRRQALQQLKAATNAKSLLAALKIFAKSQRWPENISLSEFLALWEFHFRFMPDLKPGIKPADESGSRKLALLWFQQGFQRFQRGWRQRSQKESLQQALQQGLLELNTALYAPSPNVDLLELKKVLYHALHTSKKYRRRGA